MSISRNHVSLPARRPLVLAVAMASIGMISTNLQAAEATQSMLVLPQINVVGTSEEDVFKQAGAATIVTAEQLDIIQARSTEEALRRVPGVYIKPEEESAVVFNIGIRGLSSTDPKTLILEDGVPVAPSLFVGNARYYSPRIQRIESIEVLKGASSLRYGPSTIGGVVNFRTKQPKDGLAVETSVGSWNTIKGTVEVGATSKSGDAVVGAVLSRANSDGFMDKGYDMSDAMIKAGMALRDNQWLGIKFSHYKNDANISYRGLFLEEFNAGSKRNPAPDDFFETERKALDINHQWDVNENLTVNTLLYWSDVYRDYWRFNVDNAASLAARTWIYNDTVQGNNRSFERYGAETRAVLKNKLFGVSGEAELGFRYLNETLDDVTVRADRAAPRTPRAGDGIASDRQDTAEAFAVFAQNRFNMTDRFAVTPGVRVEHYTQERVNNRNLAQEAKTRNTEVIPGISASFQVDPTMQFFGGVHKAFAPAQNGDSLSGFSDQQLDAERSVNFEVGLRGSTDTFSYEVAAFHTNFSNQIVPANSNSDFQNTNGGKTVHQGIEGAFAAKLGGGFSIETSATWIPVAEFKGDRLAGNGVDVIATDGNRVTYVPRIVANVGLGYEVEKLKTMLSVNHTGSQFTDLENTKPIVATTGFFTGQVPSYTTADLSARYAVNNKLDVFGSVKNLTDKRYIASMRQGIYVGPERGFEVGLRYEF